MKKILLLLIVAASSFSAFTQSVSLEIKNIETKKGHLQVSVFETEAQFDSEKPLKTLYFDKSNVTNGSKTVTLDLKPGTYAITVLDDEDNSKDMTYRLGVYPREGVGFSNYQLKGMSKPKFADFDFKVSPKSTAVVIEMKYF